ncbi:MAG: T9SS type A sorting domain-containing protein, partial [Candidatus Methylacidiphilales bacterium]
NRKIINSVSVDEVLDKLFIKILNTDGFASGNESLTVQFLGNQLFDVSLVDIQGKTIYSAANQRNNATVSSSGLNKGLYILNITLGSKVFNYKVIKF